MSRSSFALLLLFLLAPCASAQEFIPLWPKGEMPNSKGKVLPQIEARERITQVAVPGVEAFFPSHEETNGTAVIICPPGGYEKLTYKLAGEQWAKWMNTLGVTAFVLLYRLPSSPDLVEPAWGPIEDAQRAMKLVRGRAAEWGLDAKKIGIMGASSGGHVAAMIATMARDCTRTSDALGAVSFRPDFQILISPVITMQAPRAHRGSVKALFGAQPTAAQLDLFSPEQHMTTATATAFIALAEDDKTVNPLNGITYYEALLAHGVVATLHVFPHGDHSIALRNNPGSTEMWTALCEAWMRESGLLELKKN